MKTLQIILLAMFLPIATLPGQDSLSAEVLADLTYTFSIVEGEISGEAKPFLTAEFDNAQYTMIAEYHYSQKISQLTEALIPLLDKTDYKTMVLEVGPHTGEWLNQLPNKKTEVVSRLNALTKKYLRRSEDDVAYPIPFFNGVEDANFLGEAKQSHWDIIGIDQEYIDAYLMYIDWLYQNLRPTLQQQTKKLYQTTRESIATYYQDYDDGNSSIANSLKYSNQLQKYLTAMSAENANAELIAAMRKSLDIYGLNHMQMWYYNNETRVKYMKNNLRKALQDKSFDLAEEKLMIKMGAYHLSKGFSGLRFYEVGNMLNELAEYQGNTALNIGFVNRYYEEDEVIDDELAEGNTVRVGRKRFLEMADKSLWKVIDLRPIKAGSYYYPLKYNIDQGEEKLIQTFDLLILVPTDREATPNY